MSIEERTRVDFLAGGGELGERIRTFDWARTPLGLPEQWPQSLRTVVGLMLTSRQPIWIGWGDELTYLYNDPYKSIIGGKHPEALGQPTRVVWSEIWDVIGPMLETALGGIEGTYVESQLLIMERSGYREETHYTFSYSPIRDDDGRPVGIFCANTDDTQRVIGERQLALLHELAAHIAEARTWQQVCELSGNAFATNPRDLPFALVYVEDPDRGGLSLACATGIDRGHPAAPVAVALDARDPWPFAAALRARELVAVDELPADADLPTGAWDEPPSRAALVPLPAGPTGRGGVLVVGLNRFRLFDEGYANFLTLVAGQIAARIADTEAYEAERRRAEALAELDRAKTVFFSNVSHEFRTPLTLMLGPLDDLLSQPDAVRAENREPLEVMQRNALRLLRMVNTVLDFSRLETGQTAARFRPVDLAALTDDLADGFGALFERGGVDFVVDCRPLPEPAYVDADAWEKIVLNLLSNAFKFTLAGRVRVSLDGADGRARLRVSDTGTGIPAEELPHLFERFHRVRNEQARTQEGTGIGLALARELVELHGGTIDADSTPGEGTTFTVQIPLGWAHLPAERVEHESQPVETAGLALAYTEEAARWIGVDSGESATVTRDEALPEAQRARAGPDRLAVVDDNADMRDYLCRVLERQWQVDAYPDGQAALEAIRERPPALVVTDVMMPRLDGFGLLAALREDPATATIPVVVVSARAGEESSIEGLEAGADDYLVKPFSARELVARVQVNLELARLRAEAGRLSALEDVRTHVITTVSHELRTPVSAIYGAARTLDRADALDQDTREQLLAVIRGESDRLARITNDILTTQSLASGVLPVRNERLDLRALVEEAATATEARPGDEVRVRATIPERPVAIDADRVRLQQVLSNLLDNAVKYGAGEVQVRLEAVDGLATVVVADDGAGIPAEAREQIFERFYRGDPELTAGVGGSGLGLYISRELVRAMGGRIWVEPNDPRGSRFLVSFPTADA